MSDIPATKEFNFAAAMKELEEINSWFQQSDLDLEEALVKLKRGKELISLCQGRLKKVETEFIEIKEELESDDAEF